MRSFLKRLDRLLDAIIEIDALNGRRGRVKIVTLKVIFDNLRYYTVLAFLWIGMRLLRDADNWISRGGAALLWGLILCLGCLVVFQTSTILVAAVMSSVSALLPLRTAAKWRRVLRKGGRSLTILVLVLGFFLISIVWLVGAGLTVALGKAGLL